ncbi:MAG TPA: hypothetical protein PLT30_15795 [Deltaproteobacteria bacterium]|jgi:hypothetical protein|nr:hypothetical protein [Syntrophales bacterium]HPV30929.1 hypothetical protein [Deltaproteobacteria bacterium]
MSLLRPQRFGKVPDGLTSYHREFLQRVSDAVAILIGAKKSSTDTTYPPRSQAVTWGDFEAVTEYADNAAALAGGLKAGDLYRTGDALKVVH